MTVSTQSDNQSNRIDWPSAKALVNAFLVMDFRNQSFAQVTRTSAKDIFSPLYWVTGQNLLISCFTAGILFARVEAFAFAMVCLGVSMLVCVTSIIVEFNEIILSPDDAHVLGHQPLSLKTYSVARLANLFLYIAYIILTLTIVPTILGTGLRESSWWFAFLFPLAAVVGSLLASGCMIFVYVSFAGGPSTKVQETLAWTQAALMLVTGYGAQAILRDSRDQMEMAIYQLPQWIQYTPLGWLTKFAVSGNSGAAGIEWWILLATTAGTAVIWFLVFQRLAEAYARLPTAMASSNESIVPELAIPGSLTDSGIFNRLLSNSPDERTAYWFCKTMLRRDHNLRMRIWPTFGIPLAFLGIGVFTGELVDPLSVRGKEVMITIAAVYSLVLPVPTILFSMRFSKDHQCGWILSVAPIEDSAAFARGIEKAILGWVMLPFLFILTLILTFMWQDLLHVALHVVAAALLVTMSMSIASGLIFRQIPFSKPLGRGEMIGPIAPLLAVIGSVAMTLGGVHYFASENLGFFLTFLFLLLVITISAYFYSRKLIRQRCNLEWFHEAN